MNKLAFANSAILLALSTLAVDAAPLKCVINGKTVYTDDPSRCREGELKPINGALVIGSPTKAQASKKNDAAGLSPFPTGVEGILQHLGLTPQEVEDGWKTVLDARQRGSWQAPEIPAE